MSNTMINEFMLEEGEKELRKKIGRYEVYEIDDEFEDVLKAILEKSEVNMESKEIKMEITEIDSMIKLLKVSTNLPDSFYDTDNLGKVFKRPRRFFKQILNEITLMMCECGSDMLSKQSTIDTLYSNMSDTQRELSGELKIVTDDVINTSDIDDKIKELLNEKAKLQGGGA